MPTLSLSPVALPSPLSLRGVLPPFLCPLLLLLLMFTSFALRRRSVLRVLLVGGAVAARVGVVRVGAVGVLGVAVVGLVARVVAVVVVGVEEVTAVVEVAGVVEVVGLVGVVEGVGVAVGVEAQVRLTVQLRLVVQRVEVEVLGVDSSSARFGKVAGRFGKTPPTQLSGGDLATDNTAASRHSPHLETPLGFSP
ncbi:unnamed protein product [Closterium sp. NIES-65]|nr:unnamed protein product [Closterium sp. NIES-65]